MRGLFVAILLLLSISAYSAEYDPAIPPSGKIKFQNDLNFAFNVKLNNQTPLHKKIFGKYNKSTFKKYFDSRINFVEMELSPLYSFTLYVNTEIPNKIIMTKNYVDHDAPQIARAQLILHEARHAEAKNNFWSHVECPIPYKDDSGNSLKMFDISLAGQKACDSSELGAYALGSIYLNNISKYCTNCNEKVKMDADIYELENSKTIFNAEAKKRLSEDLKR